MTFINLEGEREATTQNSEEYGKKVIDFLSLHGYNLMHDSNIEGCFQDKIFKNIKLDGNKKTAVEVKDTKLSLTQKEFLVEFGNYYKINLKEKFNFFVFARSIANVDKWKKIFDLKRQNTTNVKEFREKVEAEIKETINSDDFNEFINNTQIYQVSYEKLFQTIEQIKKDNKYDSNEEYLTESENLVYEEEILDSNLFKVTKTPDKVFCSKLKPKSKFNSIWKDGRAHQYYQFKGMLYSLRKIDKDIISNYCDSDQEEITICSLKLDKEDNKKIIQGLIRSYIICKAMDSKLYYNREKYYFFAHHYDLSKEYFKKKVDKKRPMYLSRVFYKKGTKDVAFVLHRALKFQVSIINEEYYVVFDSFRVFTKDGKFLITGENAKKLNYKFAPTKSFNDAEKSKLFFLIDFLGLNRYHFFHANQFNFKNIKVTMPCKAEFGEVFNENFDYEENKYPTLLDYLEE